MLNKIFILVSLLVLSVTGFSRSLTTTQIRNNTIRINAMELNEIDILKIEEPKEEVVEDIVEEPTIIVVLDSRSLNFDFDKYDVKPIYYDILENFINYVEYYNYNFIIVGHTDSKGSEEYNYALGLRRAEAVRDKLIELGVDQNKILGIQSRGESDPIATNETEEGRAENRRIEFILSK